MDHWFLNTVAASDPAVHLLSTLASVGERTGAFYAGKGTILPVHENSSDDESAGVR
jgi:hypothetical protein